MDSAVVYPVAERALAYVVMHVWYKDRWLLVRHRDRSTWEWPGGRLEVGETPLQAAKRELYEEAGITQAQFIELFDYHWQNASRPGRVYLVFAEALDELPAFEMAERCTFAQPPPDMTYPKINDVLFPAVQKALTEALASNNMEVSE